MDHGSIFPQGNPGILLDHLPSRLQEHAAVHNLAPLRMPPYDLRRLAARLVREPLPANLYRLTVLILLKPAGIGRHRICSALRR